MSKSRKYFNAQTQESDDISYAIVHQLRSYTPSELRTMCNFFAPDSDATGEANETANEKPSTPACTRK